MTGYFIDFLLPRSVRGSPYEGHMVVVSRAFSQFYFHCRVLPGSSGFDGSFEERGFKPVPGRRICPYDIGRASRTNRKS